MNPLRAFLSEIARWVSTFEDTIEHLRWNSRPSR